MKTLNCGATGFFVFAPEVVHITPAKPSTSSPVDKGHDVHSVPGMIPEGAEPFRRQDEPKHQGDVYGARSLCVVACKPHTAMGMVGSSLL
jgi:plastocyanin